MISHSPQETLILGVCSIGENLSYDQMLKMTIKSRPHNRGWAKSGRERRHIAMAVLEPASRVGLGQPAAAKSAPRLLPAPLRQMDRAQPIRVSIFGRAPSHARRSLPRRGPTVTFCVERPIVPHIWKHCDDARLAGRRFFTACAHTMRMRGGSKARPGYAFSSTWLGWHCAIAFLRRICALSFQ